MNAKRLNPKEALQQPFRDERGITGLETAIVLIAFVVVSSVFAFAALSSGLFSSDRSKDTIQAGLSGARGALEVRGALSARATLTTNSLTTVTGQAVGTGNGVNTSFTLVNTPVLTNSETIYVAGVAKARDTDYTINFGTGAITFTAAPANGTAVTADYSYGNEAVGTGNGANVNFTLANSPLIGGSLTVYVAGTSKALGADYAVNYTTGAVTFTAAPANNARVDATYTSYTITAVKISLGNAAGGKPVDLTPGRTTLTYLDTNSNSQTISNFTLTGIGTTDSDNLLEAGEIIELSADVSSYGLTPLVEFTIQVRPEDGAVLRLSRTIPATIASVMDLK